MANKKEIIASVQDMLPVALEGFEVFTSAQLVKNHKQIVDYIAGCLSDNEDIEDTKEVREIIVSELENWEFR